MKLFLRVSNSRSRLRSAVRNALTGLEFGVVCTLTSMTYSSGCGILYAANTTSGSRISWLCVGTRSA